MARRLDWDKAKQPARRRPSGTKRTSLKQREQRMWAMVEFVQRHNISCFKCGSVSAEWAKTGTSRRGPWAICVFCVSKR